MLRQRIMSELTEEENTGYVIGSQVGQWYVTVASRSGSGIYIETTRNISSIYENRDAQCMRYQIGALLLTVTVGCVILFDAVFCHGNTAEAFACHTPTVCARPVREQCARAKIKSEGRVFGRLAEDFNWMADAMSRQMEQLQYEVRRRRNLQRPLPMQLKTPCLC